MASPKQLAANRANAQHSTGPRTDAGKNISRLNAVKHGLTGQILLRTPEQDAAYNAYRASLYPDLAAGDAVEHELAERIIFDSWRVRRASVIEQNLFALADPAFDTGNAATDEALNEAHAFQVNDKSINLLSLYQQRLQRGIHKDLALLRQMQKERRAEQPSAAKPNAAAKPAAKPVLQLIDSPAPQAEIGSVCPPPPSASTPPPADASNAPENMAA